jgi:hypothetical protein
MNVIGFEGQFDDDALVTWTTPALEADGWILNPRTHARLPGTMLGDLIRQGHLTLLTKPKQITTEDAENPLVLVIVRLTNPICDVALIDTGKAGGLVKHWHTKKIQYYLFTNQDAFDLYAQQIATKVLSRTINADLGGDTAKALISIGLILRSHDPFLNVFRVLTSKAERDKVKQLALARIGDNRDRQEFEKFLAAYTETGAEYTLKYDKGIAEGGGFDIDVAATTLEAFETMHEYVEPLMREMYPFLGPTIPPPRFRALRPGSAELVFATTIEDRPMQERVARYLELRLVEQILSGELPKTILFDRKMEQAVRRVAQPTPETIVTYTPLAGGDTKNVSVTWGQESELVRSPHFSALVYQSGLMKDGAKVELHVSPRRMITVSSQHTGEGGIPEGIDYLESEHDFLRRPLVATLCRHTNALGREEFWLIRLELLKVGRPQKVTAAPSSIVDGAFLIGLDISMRIDDVGTIHTSIGEVSGTEVRSLTGAKTWMERYLTLCEDHELALPQTAAVVYLRPVRPPKTSALARVILALDSLGGAAKLSKLVGHINLMFATYVRDNNTRREVLRNGRLLRFDETDDGTAMLTEAGKNWARLFQLAAPIDTSDPTGAQ